METRKRGSSHKEKGITEALLRTIIMVIALGIVAYALFVTFASAPAVGFLTDIERIFASPHESAPVQQLSATAHHHGAAPNISLTPVHTSNIVDTGYLALINRQHPVAIEPSNSLLVAAWPTVPVSFTNGMYLHPTALQAVANMMNTAQTQGIGSLFVSSGFRGLNMQATLYDNGANSNFALPPGHSEHHTGLAIDILVSGVSQAQMSNSAGGRWLAGNSYRYGLILRYPQGTTHITGIDYEPWHFRYVGKPHAYFMMRNNLVLEEYIELLQKTGGVSFEMKGTTYNILHQSPSDDMIYLPTDLEFTVSADNTGGFIVTAW